MHLTTPYILYHFRVLWNISFLMELIKILLNYIFMKLQDLEKETEFRFFLGLPTDSNIKILNVAIFVNKNSREVNPMGLNDHWA